MDDDLEDDEDGEDDGKPFCSHPRLLQRTEINGTARSGKKTVHWGVQTGPLGERSVLMQGLYVCELCAGELTIGMATMTQTPIKLKVKPEPHATND